MAQGAFYKFIREFTKPYNLAFIIFWLLFLFIWGYLWQDGQLFGKAWWFDTLGHAVFGFFGAFTLLYLLRVYAIKGIFVFAGRVFLSVFIIAIITILGVFWEAGELFWDLTLQLDYFNWIAKAQKDSIDTTADILTNTGFAFFAMLFYGLYNKWYEKYYPNEYEKEEITKMKTKIARFSKDIRKQRRRYFKKEMKPALKELVENIKEKTKRT
ncbi:hypothetical protein IIA95_00315 [Patescibacteria group bacterium]|nr:hypothetical protein [Patescibacteria group bacterium]